MKKSTAIFISFLITISFVNAQTLEEVLNNHFEAVGQDKLVKVDAVTTTGKINQGGLEIPFSQFSMRPGYVRTEGTFQGMMFIQTYNGTEGWNLNPFTGATEAQPMTDDEMKGMRIQADMDGLLWNWKEKGHQGTLEGKEDVEGTECYKVKLTTKDGDIINYFIDSETYVILRTNSKMKVQGNEVEADTYFANYMQADGIAFPGKIENRFNGQTALTISVDNVELNPQIEKTKFDKPANN